MEIDVEGRCGAGYDEKSAKRTNSRDGFRDRTGKTRAGSVELKIPKLRESSYFPSSWSIQNRRGCVGGGGPVGLYQGYAAHCQPRRSALHPAVAIDIGQPQRYAAPPLWALLIAARIAWPVRGETVATRVTRRLCTPRGA